MKLKYFHIVIIIPCMAQTGKVDILMNHSALDHAWNNLNYMRIQPVVLQLVEQLVDNHTMHAQMSSCLNGKKSSNKGRVEGLGYKDPIDAIVTY